MKIGQMSNERQMDVARKLDGRQMKIERNKLCRQWHCKTIHKLYGDGEQKRREDFFLLLHVFLNF
jgi:hypothetical protein